MPVTAATFDQTVDALMRPLADSIASIIFYAVPILGTRVPLIVLWLIGAGLFFTIYLRFVNLRGFAHAIDLVRGKYADPKDSNDGDAK